MSLPTRIAEKDPDDPVSEALESLGQSGADRGHDFPGSGAFTDPDVVLLLRICLRQSKVRCLLSFHPGTEKR